MKPVFSALVIGIALTTTAAADTVCMPAAEMEAALIDWYGEHPVVAEASADAQLWVSERAGTWSIVQSLSDGNSCVIAQGEDWTGEDASPELLAALR